MGPVVPSNGNPERGFTNRDCDDGCHIDGAHEQDWIGEQTKGAFGEFKQLL